MLCPAATPQDGPPDTGPSVLCGVMMRDDASDRHGVLVTARKDPTSYRGFCTGHYEACPVWVAERERIWRQSRVLRAVA